MSTLVTFHAHPDDEAIATAGVMAKAAADGHRVVLVTATRGEHGEVVEGVLEEGEPLAKRRTAELEGAAELLGVSKVYEATVDRDHVRRLTELRPPEVDEAEMPDPDTMDLGVAAERITTVVDVTGYLDKKRQAMAVHASQIPETSFFLSLPAEAFAAAFGQEWFILRGRRPDGVVERDLFDGLTG